MRCEVVAVGTELLLGDIVDTNSAWLGQRLAAAGIDSHFRTIVGDNVERIVTAVRVALDRSEAVIVCGGLGPTHDDVSREAIAEVMGVALRRDEELVERLRERFAERGREMSVSNERQADVPEGATSITQGQGTAPGLICPVGDDKVVYAVPGVPHELKEMVDRAVLPDLQRRAGPPSTIVSRVLHTWGLAESVLAERLAPRVEALDAAGNPTLAFLAGGMKGIAVRITAQASTREEAEELLDAEDAEIRSILGPLVFGVDDQTMEDRVGALLEEGGLTLGLAESMTGGLVASRVVEVEGSSKWFRGGVVSYDSQVKFGLLDVPEGPVVSEEAAAAMAQGACRVLEADVSLSVTGVAGPATQDGMPVGTAFFGLCLDGKTDVVHRLLPGDRQHIRQLAVITMLDLLRRRLLERQSSP
ncbi:MAG TPA: competence/damage-inducible protein A [Acidimicrobiales bacterium]|nr:competence/damage-inducible protein A [Acidimicrobiales bacterium]